MTVTPWLTHDQMVLQFFGVTEQCVGLFTDVEDMGRGLVNGNFRIEYYNSTGLTYIDGSDFGKSVMEAPYSTPVTVESDGLFEQDVCICRTKHYLQVCLVEYCDGCTTGCEYFPAFTSSDDSLAPYTHYGNYTVPCHRGSIMSFNGTASRISNNGGRPPIKTKSLVFEDKCENDAFLFL